MYIRLGEELHVNGFQNVKIKLTVQIVHRPHDVDVGTRKLLLIKPWANTTLQGFFNGLSILIRCYIVRLFDSHFLLVYFSGRKCILAHQIVPAKLSLLDHTICLNSRQSDNNSRER